MISIVILVLYCISLPLITYGKTLIIRNNDDNFYNLNNVINIYQNSKELILNFVDDYYDMSIFSNKFETTVISNISFIGNEKGTVFDYNFDCFGVYQFTFLNNLGNFVKFENITFKNFIFPNGSVNAINFIYIVSKVENFYLIFNNCNFMNFQNKIFDFNVSTKNINNDSNFIFNNCNFYNNTEKIFYAYNYSEVRESLTVELNHCNFNTNGDSDEIRTKGIFYNSGVSNDLITVERILENHVIIKNSLFENINIKNKLPLIDSQGLILEIENTTFSNCNTDYGYLIDIKKHYNNERQITIKNATFSNCCSIFTGNSCIYDISNSLFLNMTLKNSLPAISNSRNSHFTISDTEFKNMNINNGLFIEESNYKFNNIRIYDISTNSKALLYFVYNNIYINQLEARNITCIDETSFMIVDSGELHHSIILKNMKIENSMSNSSFIKFLGNKNDIHIKNSTIENVISYGPVVEDLSYDSFVTVSNFNFCNNINNNKFECGGLHFNKKLKISILDSNFKNNNSKSSGGAVCFNDITDLNLYINSSYFYGNNAIQGGALYIMDKINNSGEENYINFENNIFEKNTAENFGGALYLELNNKYKTNSNNNTIIYNKAGIMGGGIYFSEFIDKDMFNMNDFTFVNNTSNSYIDDYTSKPTYILLKTKLNSNTVNITTGDYFPLLFGLYDEFDKPFIDITKYYSSLTLKVTLEPKYNISVEEKESYVNEIKKNSEYNLLGNIGLFINGMCELKNFQIFANPNTYVLKFKMENYNSHIKFKFNDIEIIVNTCNDNQVKMYDSNGVLYCENAKCKSDCPVDKSAKCIPYYKENINLRDRNNCICLDGWEGENCQNRIYIDFR
ncbi:hypothetical protein PIROE2DRAFT_2621 [Piromyces sp. E2]|nr:hypothetical protein PIROE2DRAFT_2621 [Piromyces sp. E2]|eukprot:OUM69523.1 hypothetical protein PIROE2DRAFT_2621 [Piromyces sp. E2]